MPESKRRSQESWMLSKILWSAGSSITEHIAMTVMHDWFNNLLSIVNTLKVDSKVTRSLGIAKKLTLISGRHFERKFKIARLLMSSNLSLLLSPMPSSWCHLRKCAEIWWMFQIEEKIRAQSPDDLRGQELGRVASVHFLFSQLPEKSYHRKWKTI